MAYNGWTNYETWCVKLHMDKDEGSQRHWDRSAREAVRDFGGPDGCIPVLADRLEEWHKIEDMPQVTGVYADLLSASLSEVNWHEIAENLVEEYREEVADDNA